MLSARHATLTKDDGLFLAGVSPEVLSLMPCAAGCGSPEGPQEPQVR